MKLISSVISGPGRVRGMNQDNFYFNGKYRDYTDHNVAEYTCRFEGEYALFAVADGMGGESHGEMASYLAVHRMNEISKPATAELLQNYLLQRNEEICQFMKNNGNGRGGSTFVGMSFYQGVADVINIGDSRAYVFRPGRKLKQLSKDHTQIRQMVELGIVSPQEARTHPSRHKLSQHLGTEQEEMLIEPSAVRGRIAAGDLFLLCSDGLTDMLEDQEIENILASHGAVWEKTSVLYDRAMQAGGKDNITLLLVEAQKER